MLSNLQSVETTEERNAEDEGGEDYKDVIKNKEQAEKDPTRTQVDDKMPNFGMMMNLNVELIPRSVHEITFRERELPGCRFYL